MNHSSKTIPVVHCFNNNYCMPAAVAFYSMMEYSNPQYFYELFVLHRDITAENQELLQQTIKNFTNARLTFISMDICYTDLYEHTSNHGHYSPEMYYKFNIPNLFKQYNKVIVSDVDVLYKQDISIIFDMLDFNEDYYLAGRRYSIVKGSHHEDFNKIYDKKFSIEEQKKLLTGAGLWVFNLQMMRKNDIENKVIKYAEENAWRLIQPEQDSMNMVCWPKIKILPFYTMVFADYYQLLSDPQDYINLSGYSPLEVQRGLQSPIQLHYATSIKPWTVFNSAKSEEWFSVLFKTPYGKLWLTKIQKSLPYKQILNISIPRSKNRLLTIEINKKWR